MVIPYLCPRPKNVIKEVAPSSIFVNFSDKNPGANFLPKDPKKNLSDFLIFDMGTTTCFIANSLLSPLLHVKIHASVGYQRPCYVDPFGVRNWVVHIYILYILFFAVKFWETRSIQFSKIPVSVKCIAALNWILTNNKVFAECKVSNWYIVPSSSQTEKVLKLKILGHAFPCLCSVETVLQFISTFSGQKITMVQ